MIKMITLILTLPILLFSLSNCGGAQNSTNAKSLVQNPPFKIADAYYQNWVAGVEEGGSGVNVHINFSEIDNNVIIENIYFRNHILSAKSNENSNKQFVGYLNKNNRADVVMDKDPMREAQNIPSEISPFNLESNEAVVEYRYSGKKNYYKISNLSERKMIPYPQGNPNSHE